MASGFQKPESALKRAEQLISVGQQVEALNVLHSTISHRRLRLHGWDTNAELIMLLYVRLCVDLEKYKFAREGLHFYRTLTQQHNVLSLAKVMRQLRDLSEKKLDAIKARILDEAADTPGVDDLDADETPESLMLSMLDMDSRDETAKEYHKALAGCWETYKIIMDLLRYAPKIDSLYHDTALKALEFCRVNKRRQEFRRLCETLRLHYLNFQRLGRGRPEFEAFLRPENHLTTRIVQMDVAADLCLWTQCFQTADDILGLGLHDLLQRSAVGKDPALHKSRSILLSQVSKFYKKVAQLFQVLDQPLFHASAALRQLFHTRQHKKSVSKTEQTQLSDTATLAVLCVPVLVKSNLTATELEYQKKLAYMLGHASVPTRASMQSVIEVRGIVAAASPEVQALYALVEGDLNPMTFCTDAEKLIAVIASKPALEPYVPSLKRIVFDRLILKLGRIYTSMSIQFFTTAVCPQSLIPWREAEAMIVQLVSEGFVQLRLDYSEKMLFFGDAIASANSILRNRLVSIATVLSDTVLEKLPGGDKLNDAMQYRNAFYTDFFDKLEAEAARLRRRNQAVSDQRRKQEQEQQAREEARRNKEKEKQKKEEQEEQIRREAALKHQETVRRREEKQQQRLEVSKQIVAEFKTLADKAIGKIVIKGKPIEEITPEDIMTYQFDFEDYEKAQEELHNRERLERSRQHRHESKRVEHLVRALREADAALLDAWKQKTEEDDTKLMAELKIEMEEERRKQLIDNQRQREVLLSIKPIKQDWVAQHLAEREAEWKVQCKQRLERIREILKQRKIERARRRMEIHEKALREEEEARQREAEERQKQEMEQARRRAAEMQRLKDLEIENRARERAAAAPTAPAAGGSQSLASSSGPLRSTRASAHTSHQAAADEPDWAMLRSRPAAASSSAAAPRQASTGGAGASSRFSSFGLGRSRDDEPFIRRQAAAPEPETSAASADTGAYPTGVETPTAGAPPQQPSKYIPPAKRLGQTAAGPTVRAPPVDIEIRRRVDPMPPSSGMATASGRGPHNGNQNWGGPSSSSFRSAHQSTSSTTGGSSFRRSGFGNRYQYSGEDVEITRSKAPPVSSVGEVGRSAPSASTTAPYNGAEGSPVYPQNATGEQTSASFSLEGFTTVTRKQKPRVAKP